MDWYDARAADAIGEHLAGHVEAIGRFEVNGRHVGIRGAGWTIAVEVVHGAAGPTVKVSMSGHHVRWTLSVDDRLDARAADVAAALLPILIERFQHLDEGSIRPGDRLVARRSRWGIRRGSTFTVVRVISHRGHDPVTTYELDGRGVPRLVEVPHDDRDIDGVWRRA